MDASQSVKLVKPRHNGGSIPPHGTQKGRNHRREMKHWHDTKKLDLATAVIIIVLLVVGYYG